MHYYSMPGRIDIVAILLGLFVSALHAAADPALPLRHGTSAATSISNYCSKIQLTAAQCDAVRSTTLAWWDGAMVTSRGGVLFAPVTNHSVEAPQSRTNLRLDWSPGVPLVLLRFASDGGRSAR